MVQFVAHAVQSPQTYNELVLEIYRGVWEETQVRMASIHRDNEKSISPSQSPWTRSVRDHWRDLLTSRSLPARWIRQVDASFRLSSHPSEPTIAFVVAQRLLLRNWLLVFDEVQLLDVSSATLLADVLSWFWRMGGIIVGTSNKVPDDLYKNGVQRERLEPFDVVVRIVPTRNHLHQEGRNEARVRPRVFDYFAKIIDILDGAIAEAWY